MKNWRKLELKKIHIKTEYKIKQVNLNEYQVGGLNIHRIIRVTLKYNNLVECSK